MEEEKKAPPPPSPEVIGFSSKIIDLTRELAISYTLKTKTELEIIKENAFQLPSLDLKDIGKMILSLEPCRRASPDQSAAQVDQCPVDLVFRIDFKPLVCGKFSFDIKITNNQKVIADNTKNHKNYVFLPWFKAYDEKEVALFPLKIHITLHGKIMTTEITEKT